MRTPTRNLERARADRSLIEQALTDAGANIQDAKKFRCPFHDDADPSAGIFQCDDGSWRFKCHACDASGNVFDIVQRSRAVGFHDARDVVLSWNGSAVTRKPSENGRARKAVRTFDNPEDAIQAMLASTELKGGRLSSTWTYENQDGSVSFQVARFDFADGRKAFRPLHPVGAKWAIGDPPGRLPLYRLPQVVAAIKAGETIYICEGEKAADAAVGIGLCATTSAHGCGSAKRSNWSVLAGAHAVNLPDKGPAGEKYGETVAKILTTLDNPATVRIVNLPHLPEGGDIVDLLAHWECRVCEDIKRDIEAMAEAAGPFAPARDVPNALRQKLPKRSQGEPTPSIPADKRRQPGRLVNFETIKSKDDDKPKSRALSINAIIQNTIMGGWPKECGGGLFVPKSGDDITWLLKASSLFGYLHSTTLVIWREGPSYPTKAEFYAELLRQVESYESVERYPHEPAIPKTFYLPRPEVTAPGDALEALVSQFRPETDADRELVKAAIITPMLGGQPGSVPAFAIDSTDGDSGRGVGKTSLATMIGELWGGSFQFGTRDDRTLMLKRLLTPGEARTTRIAIVDNAKGKVTSEDLEGFITARTLSGYANYQGESRRPNTIVWFFTANGMELSKDLAQRCVCIHLAAPKYDATWRDKTFKLIDDRRDEIFADIRELLQAESPSLKRLSRWASWEEAVLAKLSDPAGLQTLIAARSAVADTELDEWDTVVEFIRFKIREAGHPDANVRIPSALASQWYIEATGETIKAQTAARRLRRLCNGQQELQPDPSRTYGRCFLYFAPHGSVDNPPLMFSDDHGSTLAGLGGSENRD